jgi:Phage integrase family
LEPLRPHDLRHTAVALWIAAGANPKEVAVRAGHTSVSFTLDRYGHLFEGHDAELRDRLDAMHAEGLKGAAVGRSSSFGQVLPDLSADGYRLGRSAAQGRVEGGWMHLVLWLAGDRGEAARPPPSASGMHAP